MSQADEIVGCAEEGCEVVSSGRCLNGIDPPLTCPHVRLANAQMEEEEREEEPEGDEGESDTLDVGAVKLQTGEALDLAGAERLARRKGVNVIALFAPREAGKTTLMAKLYETFHDGPIGDLRFAGSETVVAFEKLCHGCHVGSGASHPTTPRTRRGEPNYLHLAIDGPRGTVDFLIVDRSGEQCTEAIGSSERCRELFEIDRCDLLIVLVDGERMLDRGKRIVAVNEARRGLRALLDNGLLGHRPRVHVLLTKYDIIEAATDLKDEIDAAFEALRTSVKRELGSELPDVVFDKVAARPVQAPDTEARKLDRILCQWPFVSAPGIVAQRQVGSISTARKFLNFGTHLAIDAEQ